MSLALNFAIHCHYDSTNKNIKNMSDIADCHKLSYIVLKLYSVKLNINPLESDGTIKLNTGILLPWASLCGFFFFLVRKLTTLTGKLFLK